MSNNRLTIPLEGFSGKGLPEVHANKLIPALEKEHNCKLEFLYCTMGGSIWPKGHQKYKYRPNTATYKKGAKMASETYSLHDLPEEDPEFIPEAEVIPFKMDPKDPKDTDWLSPLAEGTVFLRKDKGQTHTIGIETHVWSKNKMGKAICLKSILLNLQCYYEWVIDPKRYCSSQELVEILRLPKEEEHGKGSI